MLNSVYYRNHLKNRILVQVHGGIEFQPADILKYFEELEFGPNTETCPPPADWDIRRRPAGYALTRKAFLRRLIVKVILAIGIRGIWVLFDDFPSK